MRLELSEDDVRWLTEAGLPVSTVPGAGHMIMWDQPERFAAALCEVLAF